MQKNSENTILEALQPHSGDVISIVGAGGKTTLMNRIAQESSGRTVVATSTRIFVPDQPWNLFVGKPITWQEDDEIVVAARELRIDKLIGFNPMCLQSGFDTLLIEADGSRRLPLKGWGPDEPVIIEETTMTIGVLDMATLGMTINSDRVYRLEAFKELGNLGDSVTHNHLCTIVCHKDGIFKRSQGKRVLFINKVEDKEQRIMAEKLMVMVDEHIPHYELDSVLIGSAQRGWAERLK